MIETEFKVEFSLDSTYFQFLYAHIQFSYLVIYNEGTRLSWQTAPLNLTTLPYAKFLVHFELDFYQNELKI